MVATLIVNVCQYLFIDTPKSTSVCVVLFLYLSIPPSPTQHIVNVYVTCCLQVTQYTIQLINIFSAKWVVLQVWGSGMMSYMWTVDCSADYITSCVNTWLTHFSKISQLENFIYTLLYFFVLFAQILLIPFCPTWCVGLCVCVVSERDRERARQTKTPVLFANPHYEFAACCCIFHKHEGISATWPLSFP